MDHWQKDLFLDNASGFVNKNLSSIIVPLVATSPNIVYSTKVAPCINDISPMSINAMFTCFILLPWSYPLVVIRCYGKAQGMVAKHFNEMEMRNIMDCLTDNTIIRRKETWIDFEKPGLYSWWLDSLLKECIRVLVLDITKIQMFSLLRFPHDLEVQICHCDLLEVLAV